MKGYFFTLCFLLYHIVARAQCPTASFSVENSVCINQLLYPQNLSTDAISYIWDFCANDDLKNTPSAQEIATPSLGGNFDVKIVESNSDFFGFVPAKNNNSLIRLDFGTDINSTPEVHDLGTLMDILDDPTGIDIIFFDGAWYGLISSFSGNKIYLLEFGSSIENTPVATDISGTLVLNNPVDVKFVENGNIYALVANYTSEVIEVLDFGSEINDTYSSYNFTLTGANNLASISTIKSCDSWFVFAISRNTREVYRLAFGNDLSTAPIMDEVASGIGFTLNDPLGVDIASDGTGYQLFVSSRNGPLYRLDFATDLTNTPSGVDLGNLNGKSKDWSLEISRNGSQWYMVSANFGGSVDQYTFENSCNSTIQSSNEEFPTLVQYEEAGANKISLEAYNQEASLDKTTTIITITSNTAPSISFTDNSNECLGQENTFTPSNLGLSTYEWSYDGGTTIGSTAISPSHTFSQTGDSIVILTVNDGTCSNFVKDTISIYPAPTTPTFSTPAAPYCTGADLAFENLFNESNYSGATLTYDWNYNGEGSTNERDGIFTFATDGTKTITLTASIPGCSTPSTGTDINLIAGPDVAFSFEDLCLGDQTQFTNSTTGTGITGQTWDFGDGSGTSPASSPSYAYSAHGEYNVSLTVNNNQGCSNELVLPVTIDDKPIAAFANGPACEGVNISFADQSSVEGLANITSYEWDFEGLGSSTNQNPNFTFDNQGSYDVELIVETTAGCRDTLISTVNVLLAPTANFEVDLGCINTETIFLDQSEGDFSNPITQWIWTIDGSLASYSSSFGEVYNDPGDHSVSLLVRSANSCQAVYNDNFTISELPVADFTIEKACDNESTIFQDATHSPSTDIESFSWQFGDEGSSTTNPATHNFSASGSYTVGLNIVDETGCEGSIQKTVTIHPSPNTEIGASTDIGPAPLTIDFTDNSQGATSSLWWFNDAENSISTEKKPQFTYNSEGDYSTQLIATSDLGCSDTTSLNITVADPVLDLELIQISTEESNDKTNITLTVKNSGNVIIQGFDIRIDLDKNSSIFESYSGTLTRGETVTYPLNFTFSSIGNNIGYACITLLDREDDFDDIDIVNNEGCIDFNQQLVIEDSYPNPVTGTDRQIRLNMILPANAPVQIFLLDATGAILYQEIYMDAKAGLNSFFVDIYSFEQGMYFIKTVYDQNESTQRFIKL